MSKKIFECIIFSKFSLNNKQNSFVVFLIYLFFYKKLSYNVFFLNQKLKRYTFTYRQYTAVRLFCNQIFFYLFIFFYISLFLITYNIYLLLSCLNSFRVLIYLISNQLTNFVQFFFVYSFSLTLFSSYSLSHSLFFFPSLAHSFSPSYFIVLRAELECFVIRIIIL